MTSMTYEEYHHQLEKILFDGLEDLTCMSVGERRAVIAPHEREHFHQHVANVNTLEYRQKALKPWKKKINLPLFVDIYLHDVGTCQSILIERWMYVYQQTPEDRKRMNFSPKELENSLLATRGRLLTLIRTIFAFLRLLPGYEFVKIAKTPPTISFDIYSPEQSEQAEFAFETKQYSFNPPLKTLNIGTLYSCVVYVVPSVVQGILQRSCGGWTISNPAFVFGSQSPAIPIPRNAEQENPDHQGEDASDAQQRSRRGSRTGVAGSDPESSHHRSSSLGSLGHGSGHILDSSTASGEVVSSGRPPVPPSRRSEAGDRDLAAAAAVSDDLSVPAPPTTLTRQISRSLDSTPTPFGELRQAMEPVRKNSPSLNGQAEREAAASISSSTSTLAGASPPFAETKYHYLHRPAMLHSGEGLGEGILSRGSRLEILNSLNTAVQAASASLPNLNSELPFPNHCCELMSTSPQTGGSGLHHMLANMRMGNISSAAGDSSHHPTKRPSLGQSACIVGQSLAISFPKSPFELSQQAQPEDLESDLLIGPQPGSRDRDRTSSYAGASADLLLSRKNSKEITDPVAFTKSLAGDQLFGNDELNDAEDSGDEAMFSLGDDALPFGGIGAPSSKLSAFILNSAKNSTDESFGTPTKSHLQFVMVKCAAPPPLLSFKGSDSSYSSLSGIASLYLPSQRSFQSNSPEVLSSQMDELKHFRSGFLSNSMQSVQ